MTTGKGPIGLLFPGQGSQKLGMGRALAQAYPEAAATFAEADEALGYSLSRLMWEGQEIDLEATEVQQPAILSVSVAAWRVLAPRLGQQPAVALGLSLGEYSAYVAADALRFADAVPLTRLRGRAMQEAVPAGRGGMLAIMGLDAATVEGLCRQASAYGVVEPANYNAPGQTVCAGEVAALEALARLAQQTAKVRVVRLAVSAPFHCSLLAPASRRLAEALQQVPMRDPRFPVIANVDGALCTRADDIPRRLVDQVSAPVRFEQGMRKALAMGVRFFLELGPGRTLASLARKIDRHVEVVSVEDPAGVEAALESLASRSYN